MTKFAKWSLAPLALAAAAAAGFLAARGAAADTPDLGVLYTGKFQYRSADLGPVSETDRGTVPCGLFVAQTGDAITATLQFSRDEERLSFDLSGRVGNDRFYLVGTTAAGGTIVLTGRVSGIFPKRTLTGAGSLVEDLEVNDIKVSIREFVDRRL